MDPIALALLGISGAGKSTTASLLAAALRELGYPTDLIRFDQVRKDLAPAGVDPYSSDPAVKQIIYDRAIGIFNGYLDQGISLVIDTGLTSERIRRRLKDQIPNLRIVHIYCPLWLAILRDTRRSLGSIRHERGPFLYLRALRDRLNPFVREKDRFPQPCITYPFEYPDCADLHISTRHLSPQAVADLILRSLGDERLACGRILLTV